MIKLSIQGANVFEARSIPTTDDDAFGGILNRWDIHDIQTGKMLGKLVEWDKHREFGFFPAGRLGGMKINFAASDITFDYLSDDTQDNHKAWRFVEDYYPSYSSSNEITRNQDLLVLIELGTASADEINEYKTTLVNIYNAAIEAFLAKVN